MGGKHWAIAHVDCNREGLRETAAERLWIDAPRRVDDEAQRCFIGATARRGCKDAATKANSDDGKPARKEVARKAQFGAEAWHKLTAHDAERPGAENEQAGIIFRRDRDHSTRSEWPAISEAYVSPLEVVFHQA